MTGIIGPVAPEDEFTYRFTTELWEYPGDAAWHFVTLPEDAADEITAVTEGLRRGFGSVRVEVTIEPSTWTTSIFPDKRSGSFMLPVKKPVRAAAQIEAGDVVDVELSLLLELP